MGNKNSKNGIYADCYQKSKIEGQYLLVSIQNMLSKTDTKIKENIKFVKSEKLWTKRKFQSYFTTGNGSEILTTGNNAENAFQNGLYTFLTRAFKNSKS